MFRNVASAVLQMRTRYDEQGLLLYTVSHNNSTANQHAHHMTMASSRRPSARSPHTLFRILGKGHQNCSLLVLHYSSRILRVVKASVLGVDKSHVPNQVQDPVAGAKKQHPQAEYKWVGHIVKMLGSDFVDTHLYPHSLSYQDTSFMNEELRPTPASASNMLDLGCCEGFSDFHFLAAQDGTCEIDLETHLASPTKSFETTSSSV